MIRIAAIRVTIITCTTAVCLCFYLCSPTPPTNRSHTCAYVTRMKNNICFYLCSPTPRTTRSHTCAYVTRMKDNLPRSFEPRHVIPDTRISSGQCPRCDVNVTLGSRDFNVIRNKRDLRHIHVKKSNNKWVECATARST
jgi:hypothetical protein